MRNALLWKGAFILGTLALAVAMSVPPRERIRLGLDLKGGIHLVMDVNTDDAIKSEADQVEQRLRSELRKRGITFGDLQHEGLSTLVLKGALPAERDAVRALFSDQAPGWSVREGTEGMWRVALDAQQDQLVRDTAVRQALETLRERIDSLGVAEPVIQRMGLTGSRILVQLPGLDDPGRVKDFMVTPAFLEWKLASAPPGQTAADLRAFATRESLLAAFGGTLPDDTEIYTQNMVGSDGRPLTVYWPLKKASPISGHDLNNARRGQGNLGEPVVDFFLTPDAGSRFMALTRENIGQPLAILLDKKVISTPTIRGEIGDKGIIEGRFTVQDAEDLALKLRSGALPASIRIVEERTVGPSLGLDSIRQGVQAALIGLGLVVLFMVIYYRLSGINAVLALALNMVLTLGFMAYVKATLTLPGIAGLILTIGMAVDANVLIFERIREELALGKTVRAAVDAGFKKAFSAILDSNVTTIIAAVFLFTFGTGPIKGFAVTLTFGLAASMFTAIYVSRYLYELVLKSRPAARTLSI
jgi:preprotein translocase subunit SecD